MDKTYTVKASNGASYSPDYPYEGLDKNIATTIAAAYIAQGKKVFVYENDVAEQNHQQFTTAEEAMDEYERDIDIFQRDRPGYQHFAKWLYSKVKKD